MTSSHDDPKDQTGRKAETGRIGDGVDRRAFLTGAGVAGAAAAGVGAAIGGERQPPAEQIKPRYQLTEHVKRFYFLNRL